MRKLFFSILLLFLSGVIPYIAYSDSNIYDADIMYKDIKTYFSHISDQEIEALMGSGMIERFPSSAEDFRFIPDIPLKKDISDSLKKIKFNIATESLYFLPYKKESEDNRKTLLIDSFTIATNIEKLKGIKYYSLSHKGERVLFEKAEIISGRVPYPVTEVPTTHLITAQIQDSTFGDYKYKIEYNSLSDFLVMKMSNTETFSLAFFPVIGKESLLFYIIIIPVEEGFFLYCSGICKTIDSDYIKKKGKQYVYNRVIALYNWFRESYNSLY
ncbi:MAG: hypothetical protein FWE72_06555 [Spirochaetaceae bacterium]|nr:hypothetical protein [Spirochaetaceae bacterium]